MKAPNTPRTPQIPTGSHIAIPYQIIYLGVQKTEGQWGVKYQPKVSITFEFPNLKAEFEDKNTGVKITKPKALSNMFTFSMSENGNLRPIVEGIVGSMSETQAEDFDLDTILGKACLIQIEIKNDYSNIKSTMVLPEGMPVPNQYNSNKVISYETITEEEKNKLPDFLKEKINYGQKYAKETAARNNKSNDSKGTEEATVEYGASINPEDIPF